MYKYLSGILFFLIVSTTSFAQNKPFWNEILEFRKKDSLQMPPSGGVVFVGSSSFRMWKDAEKQFSAYKVINRGFGGSNLVQANMYIKELVIQYKPAQVVIYSGENDIAEGASALETASRFATFFTNIRNQLPESNIVFVSIKSSPSRLKHKQTFDHANLLIKDFLKYYTNTTFIDIDTKMKTRDGQLRPELFLQDMLHMKPEGYEIWTKAITPYLLKNK
ncbi:MAG: hypothetical protein EOO89_04920 [Pedobacter sp.]|nr:MAG: hypothetical protein EOO89_04920 [Pedobacter sp.]